MAEKVETKNITMNTFTGGMVTDSQPLITPRNVLTDCINGTIITHNGNEYTLQNDIGNEITRGVLPVGHTPITIKEYNGIIYIVSKNIDGGIEIGSFPSPSKLQIQDYFTDTFDVEFVNSSEYSYEEVLSKLNSQIKSIKGGKYFKIDYTSNGWSRIKHYLINADSKTLIHPNSDYWREVQTDSTLSAEFEIVNIYDAGTKVELFKVNNLIKGNLKALFNYNDLTNTEFISFDININDDHIVVDQYQFNVNNCIEFSLPIELPMTDNTFTIEIKPIYKVVEEDEYFSIIYNTTTFNVDPSTLSSKTLYAFDNMYYFNVDDGGVNIFFDVHDYSDITELTCSICKINENFELEYVNSQNITKEGTNKNLYFPFSSEFVKNKIYLFEVKVGDSIERRILITSDLFNTKYTYNTDLDYSKYYANDWLNNINFETVTGELSYTDGDVEIKTNDGPEGRKFIINNAEFVKNYLPYICSASYNDSVNPFIVKQVDRHWTLSNYEVVGELKDILHGKYDLSISDTGGNNLDLNNLITSKKVGYKLTFDTVTDNVKLYPRQYFTKSNPVTLNLTVDEANTDLCSDSFTTLLMQSLCNELKSDKYINYWINLEDTPLTQASLLYDRFKTGSNVVTDDAIEIVTLSTNNSYKDVLFPCETELGLAENWDTETYVNTLIYDLFIKKYLNESTVFIPLILNVSSNNASITIHRTNVSMVEGWEQYDYVEDKFKNINTPLYGCACICKTDSGYSITLLKTQYQGVVKVFTSDSSVWDSIINYICSHYYYIKPDNRNMVELITLTGGSIDKINNDFNTLYIDSSKFIVNDFIINNVKLKEVMDLFKSWTNDHVNNITFLSELSLNYDLNVNSIESFEEIDDVDEFKIELKNFKNVINSHVLQFNEEEGIYSDINDTLYNENNQINIQKITFGDKWLKDCFHRSNVYGDSKIILNDSLYTLSLDMNSKESMNLTYVCENILPNIDISKNGESIYHPNEDFSTFKKRINYENN